MAGIKSILMDMLGELSVWNPISVPYFYLDEMLPRWQKIIFNENS